MARQIAYFRDPEEEERRRLELIETFGPPESLGTHPIPSRADIEMARERALVPAPVVGDRGRDVSAEYETWASDPENLRDIEDAEPDPGGDLPAPQSLTAYDPATAQNPFDEAPRPVDKQAALRVEANKGTPAAGLTAGTDFGAEQGWADELLKEVRSRVLEKPEQSESALHQKAEGFAADSLDPVEGFSRERAAARAREAYGEDTPPSSRWEDEFKTSHKQLSDRDVQRSFLLQSLWHGNDHGLKVREMLRGEQAGYEEGIAKARDRDRLGTRVSRGLAEAIAATGQVSPEEAGQLTYQDPLVKAFSSGLYAQGGRAEGQALGLKKAQMKEAFDLIKSDKLDDRTRGLAMLNSLTQLQTADIRAQAASQQVDPAVLAQLLPSWIQRTVRGLSSEQAARVATGDTKGLTPEQVEQVQKVLPSLIATLEDPKTRGRVLGSIATTETTGEAKNRFSVQLSVDKAKNDRKYRQKFKQDWLDASNAFRDAWSGWKELSDDGKKAFAEWAAGGWTGKIRSFMMNEGDQQRIGRVQGVINALVKDRSGSAVTGSEWERIATEIGIEAEDWNPFNTPAAIEDFLRRSGKKLTSHRAVFEDEIGWEVPDGGQ